MHAQKKLREKVDKYETSSGCEQIAFRFPSLIPDDELVERDDPLVPRLVQAN
jgi:hypothetical protein